jgi:hypothetical protein
MALTPGGGQSRGTLDKTPPPPTRSSPPKSPKTGRTPRWTRSATMSVLRLGLLFGGLVIIVDLGFTALQQRSLSADDVQAWETLDEILNYVLFSVLGVMVVRETNIIFAGAVAGLLAGLLDAIVVTAASLMVPPQPTLEVLEIGIARNLIIGLVFAGLSGVVYALVQRWSSGQRPR